MPPAAAPPPASMQALDFEESVRRIVGRGSRFAPEAFHFVRAALEHAGRQRLRRHSPSFTGQDLLCEIREYVIQEFGPMGFFVLSEWGIRRCEDVGEIVQALSESGCIPGSHQDIGGDFASIYDFREAFVRPFLPPSRLAPKARKGRRPGKGCR